NKSYDARVAYRERSRLAQHYEGEQALKIALVTAGVHCAYPAALRWIPSNRERDGRAGSTKGSFESAAAFLICAVVSASGATEIPTRREERRRSTSISLS